jgi:hypothetical protein
MKTCTQCYEQKDLDCFYKRKQAKDGLEAFCKDCRNKRNAKWFAGNQKRHNQMMVDWYNRNKDRHLENSKKWYNQNKERKLMTTNAREKRCRQATPTWADLDIMHYLYEQSRIISEQTGVPHEVDHIYPLKHTKLCGLNVHWNMQIITAEQNRRKSNRIIHSQNF